MVNLLKVQAHCQVQADGQFSYYCWSSHCCQLSPVDYNTIINILPNIDIALCSTYVLLLIHILISIPILLLLLIMSRLINNSRLQIICSSSLVIIHLIDLLLFLGHFLCPSKINRSIRMSHIIRNKVTPSIIIFEIHIMIEIFLIT